MAVVVLALIGGLLISLATGGSLQRLGRVRLRRWWLLILAVVAQQASLAVGHLAEAGYAVSVAAAAGFVIANRGFRGLSLIALGLLSNFVAILANDGAMPVSLTALGSLGQGYLAEDSLHTFATSHTRLRLLTDVIAVHIPFGQGGVLSVGDVLVSAGVGLAAFSATRSSGVGGYADGEKGA